MVTRKLSAQYLQPLHQQDCTNFWIIMQPTISPLKCRWPTIRSTTWNAGIWQRWSDRFEVPNRTAHAAAKLWGMFRSRGRRRRRRRSHSGTIAFDSVLDYNDTKDGVDTADQPSDQESYICECSQCSHVSKRSRRKSPLPVSHWQHCPTRRDCNGRSPILIYQQTSCP